MAAQYTIKDFEDLLNSDSIEVKQLTDKTLYYKFLFDNKEINEEEYTDLLKDLKNLEIINKELMTVDIWNKCMQAITVINTLRSLAII